MKLLRSAILAAIGWALLVAPAHAISLAELFQGSSITAGGLNFTDWTLNNLLFTGGSVANLDQIIVNPPDDGLASPALSFLSSNGALGTSANHPSSASVLLVFSFNARTISGLPLIEGSTLELSGYRFSSRADSVIRIIEDLRNGGLGLGQNVTIVFRDDPPDSPLLVGESAFDPQPIVRIDMRIDISGPQSNDLVQLNEFNLRFSQAVPEPNALALFGWLMLWLATRRTGRRRKSP